MSESKIGILKEKIKDTLMQGMYDSRSQFSTGEVIEELVNGYFYGYVGFDNITDLQLLEVYRDENWAAFDEDEIVNEDQDDYHQEIRDLAAEFELELVAEKELLGEVKEIDRVEEHLESCGIQKSDPEYYRLYGIISSFKGVKRE